MNEQMNIKNPSCPFSSRHGWLAEQLTLSVSDIYEAGGGEGILI